MRQFLNLARLASDIISMENFNYQENYNNTTNSHLIQYTAFEQHMDFPNSTHQHLKNNHPELLANTTTFPTVHRWRVAGI